MSTRKPVGVYVGNTTDVRVRCIMIATDAPEQMKDYQLSKKQSLVKVTMSGLGAQQLICNMDKLLASTKGAA